MRAELAGVLSSRYLSRAPTLVTFLSYVCEKHFRGETDQIKEYTIALEAFGRPDTFEPKRDPIVRVDANRLRLRLLKYYRNEGRNHAIKIWLPKGQYVPVFELCDQAQGDNGGAPLAIADRAVTPASASSPSQPAPVHESPGHPRPIAPLNGNRPNSRRGIPAPVYSLAGLMVLILSLSVLSVRWSGPPSSQADPSPLPVSSVPGLPGEEVRILCGNSASRYIDQVGRIWGGDRFFAGGRPFSTTVPISRAEDPAIWQTGREGDFSYDIPLNPDIYEVRLYFAEPILYGADQTEGGGETTRLFDLFVNGQPTLSIFDIIADAGGARTADIKVLTDVTPSADGALHLRLKPRKSQPILNAIEILPGIPGRIRPIQITTSSFPVYSTDRTLWGADRYFAGGRRVSYSERVTGSDSPQIYGSERFGNFTYCIPVAPGSYTARLHFREAYFGRDNLGKGGPGSRIFDVYCNGVILLKHFDVFVEAGGSDRALMKEFHGLEANAQGKLVFNFQPVTNYALVNAVEIIQEPAEQTTR